MPYGAIISSLVNVGFDIAGQLSKPDPQQMADQYSTRIREAAGKYIIPFAENKDYWNLDIPGMAKQSIDFGLSNVGSINKSNMAQLQTLMDQAMPGWKDMFGKMQGNTTDLLSGKVPQDVQDQIRNNAAYSSLVGGTSGAGMGMTGAITARDLGLTSLQLENQGQQQGTNLMSFARNYLMPQPVNPMSLLPLSDLISGTEWTKSGFYQANEAAYTAKVSAAGAAMGVPAQSILPGVGSDISSIIGLLSKKPDSSSSGGGGGGSSIFGMLGGLLGGGGGGGGGGGSGGANFLSGLNFGG